MRKKDNHKYGDTRIITKFLATPMTINGETRWLEHASIEQKYIKYYKTEYMSNPWANIRWANE